MFYFDCEHFLFIYIVKQNKKLAISWKKKLWIFIILLEANF